MTFARNSKVNFEGLMIFFSLQSVSSSLPICVKGHKKINVQTSKYQFKMKPSKSSSDITPKPESKTSNLAKKVTTSGSGEVKDWEKRNGKVIWASTLTRQYSADPKLVSSSSHSANKKHKPLRLSPARPDNLLPSISSPKSEMFLGLTEQLRRKRHS